MGVSCFKTQWFNLLIGVVDLGMSFYNFCTGDELWGIGWTVAAMMWFLMSFITFLFSRKPDLFSIL